MSVNHNGQSGVALFKTFHSSPENKDRLEHREYSCYVLQASVQRPTMTRNRAQKRLEYLPAALLAFFCFLDGALFRLLNVNPLFIGLRWRQAQTQRSTSRR